MLDLRDGLVLYSKPTLTAGSAMTKLLEKAFEAASKLPAEEQDALAASILAEVEAERRWDALFEGSVPALEQLADQALDEHRRKETLPFTLKGE